MAQPDGVTPQSILVNTAFNSTIVSNAIDVSDGTGRDLADGESGTDSCTVDPVRSCRST